MLLQLGKMVGKDWQNLGFFLLVSDNELNAIESGYSDMEEKAHRMFCAWKNQQNFPTLNVLANAIYKINRIDLITVLKQFSSTNLFF